MQEYLLRAKIALMTVCLTLCSQKQLCSPWCNVCCLSSWKVHRRSSNDSGAVDGFCVCACSAVNRQRSEVPVGLSHRKTKFGYSQASRRQTKHLLALPCGYSTQLKAEGNTCTHFICLSFVHTHVHADKCTISSHPYKFLTHFIFSMQHAAEES